MSKHYPSRKKSHFRIRKSKMNNGGYSYNSLSPKIVHDEIFLRIVENTKIINKEKNKNSERQSDELNYTTFLVDSDIDNLIANHETLDRAKVIQMVNQYIKSENLKNNKKWIKSLTKTKTKPKSSNKTTKKKRNNTI